MKLSSFATVKFEVTETDSRSLRACTPSVVDDLPGHDVDDLLGVREADPGQVRPHRPREALAPQLCSLCRLRIHPQ